MGKDQDFASGMFSSDKVAAEIPRDEHGTLRCMAVTEPCRTSADLEARAAWMKIADAKFEAEGGVEFVSEDGTPEISPLSEIEHAELREHFTDAEWQQLQAYIRGN